jgi:enoyl-CoA hydratase/carnithine racemase
MFRTAMQPSLEAFLDYEAQAQNLVLHSDDRKEGVAAFMDKPKPKFIGH